MRAFAVQARLAREQIVDALVHYERAHDEKPGKVYAAAIARMKARLEGR